MFFCSVSYVAQLCSTTNKPNNSSPQVTFTGYSIPHPTEHVVNMRVQTTGEVTAAQALVTACEECSKVCKHIRSSFDAAVKEYKQQHPEQQQQQPRQQQQQQAAAAAGAGGEAGETEEMSE